MTELPDLSPLKHDRLIFRLLMEDYEAKTGRPSSYEQTVSHLFADASLWEGPA
jgi:hypothetical protein